MIFAQDWRVFVSMDIQGVQYQKFGSWTNLFWENVHSMSPARSREPSQTTLPSFDWLFSATRVTLSYGF